MCPESALPHEPLRTECSRIDRLGRVAVQRAAQLPVASPARRRLPHLPGRVADGPLRRELHSHVQRMPAPQLTGPDDNVIQKQQPHQQTHTQKRTCHYIIRIYEKEMNIRKLILFSVLEITLRSFVRRNRPVHSTFYLLLNLSTHLNPT